MRLIKTMMSLIFGGRWLQAPFYLGLIVAQGVCAYQFMMELTHPPRDQEQQPE